MVLQYKLAIIFSLSFIIKMKKIIVIGAVILVVVVTGVARLGAWCS